MHQILTMLSASISVLLLPIWVVVMMTAQSQSTLPMTVRQRLMISTAPKKASSLQVTLLPMMTAAKTAAQ